MNGIDLKRLEFIRKLGKPKDFSFWEYLYAKGDGPEIALAYAKAFWPDFIEVNGFILLAENYDEAYFNQTYKQYGSNRVEATINTTYLTYLFGTQDVDDGVWEALGGILCETWKACAELCFPGKSFVTEFTWYSEDGDPGLTLQQAKWVKGC